MDNALIDTILKVLISSAAALGGWIGIFRPLYIGWKTKKTKAQGIIDLALSDDKIYRQEVLHKLNDIKDRIASLDRLIADLQRDNIERAYCMFVVEHGYCPSGMKDAIFDSYKSYKERGFNHIAESRVNQILALPEFPVTHKAIIKGEENDISK